MSVFKMSDEERKKISNQHKTLEKQTKEKKDELKKGLQQPEKKETKKTS